MPIMKLARHDAKRELAFELDYLAFFSTSKLFARMVQRSNEIKEMLIRYGHREPVAIIKCPARSLRRPKN